MPCKLVKVGVKVIRRGSIAATIHAFLWCQTVERWFKIDIQVAISILNDKKNKTEMLGSVKLCFYIRAEIEIFEMFVALNSNQVCNSSDKRTEVCQTLSLSMHFAFIYHGLKDQTMLSQIYSIAITCSQKMNQQLLSYFLSVFNHLVFSVVVCCSEENRKWFSLIVCCCFHPQIHLGVDTHTSASFTS